MAARSGTGVSSHLRVVIGKDVPVAVEGSYDSVWRVASTLLYQRKRDMNSERLGTCQTSGPLRHYVIPQ